MSSPSIQGKVSLITGAGRRTGRALALRLAQSGCKVALLSRTTEDLEAASREIKAAGGEVLVQEADVTSEEDCRRAVAAVLERWGRLDHLINAAGVYLTGSFHTFPVEDWSRTLDTYLTGPFLCCRAALEALKEGEGGHIINFSSLLVEMALPGFEAYCAAKGGLEAFSRTLANSLRSEGVKVSVIVPGAINAGGQEPNLEKMLEREDIAEAVLYLLRLPSHVHVPQMTLRTAQ